MKWKYELSVYSKRGTDGRSKVSVGRSLKSSLERIPGFFATIE